MRKYLITFLIIISAVFCASGIAACAPDGLGAHSWSADWSSNINSHWHRCTDSGCNGRENYEEHDWQLTTTYEAATCGDKGTGQYTCSVCKATLGNKVTPATIPATGEHEYKLISVDVDPTCGEEGYGSYICEVCYDYSVFPIPATGEHDFSGKYVSTEEGHCHVCLHGCGTDDGIQPHEKGEGKRVEPSGTKDGRIEYRCTVCNYLLETEIIPNTNILHHFEVKFVKVNNSSIVAIPELGEDGELYVTLSVSSNAMGGYKLEFTGYNADGKTVTVPKVDLYYYDEYTAEKRVIDFQHGGVESTGYMGYTNNWFYISRETEDVSLLLESTSGGRDPVTLKVHIKAVKGTVSSSVKTELPVSEEITAYFQDRKDY